MGDTRKQTRLDQRILWKSGSVEFVNQFLNIWGKRVEIFFKKEKFPRAVLSGNF